jgi:hypothetical protein
MRQCTRKSVVMLGVLGLSVCLRISSRMSISLRLFNTVVRRLGNPPLCRSTLI